MAKDKDRAQNPAAAQRKLEKQKALKKGKAQVAAQRTERLAHRNPHRLESQIADLHALRESAPGGKLSTRDQKQLEELERDVARVKKARESLGDKAPAFGGRGDGGERRGDGDRSAGRGGRRGEGAYRGLGKRGRDGVTLEKEEESEETDEDVRQIPWPKDTPPPVPRTNFRRRQQQQRSEGTSANREPLGAERFPGRRKDAEDDGGEGEVVPDTSLPVKPSSAAAVRTTYESKPQVRDLRKEATARFVPSAVKRKIDATKGVGGKLLEEEEMDKLEQEGYGTKHEGDGVGKEILDPAPLVSRMGSERSEEEAKRLREEEEAFQRALENEVEEGEGLGRARKVEIEEVSDEDM